jgi:hypothetical protein
MVILSILCDFIIIQLLKIVTILKSSRLHQARAAGIPFFCFEALSRVTDFYP